MSERTDALARRLEQGAEALIDLASGLTESEWNIRIPRDGRKIGVVVHHVAFMYPLEIQLAQVMAKGEPVVGITSATIDDINAKHAKDQDGVTKAEALEAVRRNSAAAATAIRALSDQELDQAAPLSLNADAPLTTQFMLEDHAVRHSYHHAAKIRAALQGTVLRKVG